MPFLYWLAGLAVAFANDVPTFTPNVVDTAQVLGTEEVAEINETLKDVRDRADIWGAVLIVDRLEDDTVETLAEKAFNTWKLGQKKKDNGLLLVLAMKDRRSRLEVGYGLEGDLPDAITKRALDDVLRPHMRSGDTKTAIVQTFQYLAAVRTKDGSFQMPETAADDTVQSFDDVDWSRGLQGLLAFYALLWLMHPVAKFRALRLARRLQTEYPEYRLTDDRALNRGKDAWKTVLFGDSVGGSLAIRGFLSLNPGIFILFGAGLADVVLYVLLGIFGLIAVFYYRGCTARYASRDAYRKWIERARRRNARMVQKGYMRESSPGVFEHTQAWYSSDEYRASRSSSSSSSSSSGSSSSGGGSSGGGGSSSSW